MKDNKSRNNNNEQLQNVFFNNNPNYSLKKSSSINKRLKKEAYIDIDKTKNNCLSYEMKQKEIEHFYSKQLKEINDYQNSKNEAYVNVVKNRYIKQYIFQNPYKNETLEIQKISKRTYLSSTKAKYHSTNNINDKKGKLYLIENRKELINEESKNNNNKNNDEKDFKTENNKKEIIINNENNENKNNTDKNFEKTINNKNDKKNNSHHFLFSSNRHNSKKNIFRNKINKLNLEENKNSENNNRDKIYNSLKEINLFLEDNYSNKNKYNKEKSKAKFNNKINKIKKILKKHPSCPSIHNTFKGEGRKALHHCYTSYFFNKKDDKLELFEKDIKNLKTNNNRKFCFDVNSKFVEYDNGDKLFQLLSKIPKHSSKKESFVIKKYSDFAKLIDKNKKNKKGIENYRSKKSSGNKGIMPPNNLGDVLFKQGIDFFSK